MASKVGVFFHCSLFAYYPGGRWGNTNQWQHSEASGIALGMLHWAMRFVWHRRTDMAIKMAGGQGALFPIVIFCLTLT
jgi:hypothetical protein